jgi:hypothetical protein
MFSHRISYRDWIAFAAVLLLAALLAILPLLTARTGALLVVTTPEGEMLYPLSQNDCFEIVSQGITLSVVIEDGAAYVKESTCPDGVCRSTRSISKSGETVLCAPAGVTLTVRGGDGDVDFVAG